MDSQEFCIIYTYRLSIYSLLESGQSKGTLYINKKTQEHNVVVECKKEYLSNDYLID